MATIENQAQATRRIIWGMLSENTGTHMMDSGGNNGRAWQRNQATGFDAACAAPSARIEGYAASSWQSPSGGVRQEYPAYYTITLSALHYLADRVIPVSAEHPAAHLMRVIEHENPDESWLGVQDYFREACEDAGAQPTTVHNTYNFDNLLSQDWQGFAFSADGPNGEPNVPMLCIGSHNGADIRGGYSRPHLFHLPYYGQDVEYAEACLLAEATNAYVYCENPKCAEHDPSGSGMGWAFQVYGPDRVGWDGAAGFDDSAEWETLTCPQCGTPDSVRAESTEPCG